MNELVLGVSILVVGLILGAFFSVVETALTTLSPLKTKHLIEKNPKSEKVLDLWLKKSENVLAATLIGNNLVNIFVAVYAENMIIHYFGPTSIWLVTLFLTVVIVLFSEIIPKTLSKQYASQIAIPSLSLFRYFYWILLPLTISARFTMETLIRMAGRKRKTIGPAITEEELEYIIDVSEEEGVIAEQKHEMLSGVLELEDTMVREIMVHRLDMVALPRSTKIREMIEVMRETGRSRIPIYHEKIDDIVGVVNVKDLLFVLKNHRDSGAVWESPVESIKRDVIYVHESKSVYELFQEFKKKRQHLAVVIDEYGGTSGVVTMEDIFEEIVGEVRDEFDNEEDSIKPTQIPHQFLVDCRIRLNDFCEHFEIDKQKIEQENENSEAFDTLAGYIVHKCGQIPKLNDKFYLEHISIEVIEVSKRRVRRVLVKPSHQDQDAGISK